MKETKLGTVRYSLYFFISSIIIHFCYAALTCLFRFNYQGPVTDMSYGVLPIFIAEMISDCISHPEEPRSYLSSLL
jgi:hypothetical protein